MLRINRLRVEINTLNGIYGIDSRFYEGLNFIASEKNTCGKSSVLAAIYYCLGLEQIIGGVAGIGSKVLTAVFKSAVEDNGKMWTVTESRAYLEISNGNEIITIRREAVSSDNRDDRLVTVFFGDFDAINDPKTNTQDMFVNVVNAATGARGFHTYLEEFLHLDLPEVRTSDDNERKLYLQVVFSSMFIEQKHGWSDIFSGMPIFGFRESKKRIVEYILNLDTQKNEKERDRLKATKAKLEQDWEQLVSEIQNKALSESSEVKNLPLQPKVLTPVDYDRIHLVLIDGTAVAEEIANLQDIHDSLKRLKPRVLDNFDELNAELAETENTILSFEEESKSHYSALSLLNGTIGRLTRDLEIITADIRNNNDAARLQRFGSEATGDLSANVCPVCKQNIHDTLLLADGDGQFMNIEENIRHLKAQKSILEFSLESNKHNKEKVQNQITDIESKLLSLRRLANAIRSDLFTTTDADSSEAILLKKIELSRRIEDLTKLQVFVKEKKEEFKSLSSQWAQYLADKKNLPEKGLSGSDSEKIALLKKYFIANLRQYHYSSVTSFDGIQISEESFLPTIDGFDMKFDSSASDGVRVIWAFTMALLQVSLAKGGNHPRILILDEPAQQSIVSEDMQSFINSVIALGDSCQVIIAITKNSEEIKAVISKLDENTYNEILIEDKAFRLLEADADSTDDASEEE